MINVAETNPTNDSIEMYPNPAIDKLTLKVNGKHQTISQIQIIDLTGKIIRNEKINNQTKDITISVKNLSVGKYFLKVILNNQEILKPFEKI